MNGIESIFLGLLNEVSSRTDMSISNELQNKLPASPFSLMDLAATNIARGRDHGIQPYTKVFSLKHFLKAVIFHSIEFFL